MSHLHDILRREAYEASAPCRIDMGGTFDLSTFYLPLRHWAPCTFNAAINMRTQVRLSPFEEGKIRIRSRGFDDLVVDAENASFGPPMGLMLAVAAYFKADGVAIDIHSESPTRSALGGSSVAAVALIWAFSKALASEDMPLPGKSAVAQLAHAIEQSVAGVPCGRQDQLAAVYGGVNAWDWHAAPDDMGVRRRELIPPGQCDDFSRCILVAYCGNPHASEDINGTWVRRFIRGERRDVWHEMNRCVHQFVAAVAVNDISRAQEAMNRETELRRQLTPGVLDDVGIQLVDAAVSGGCGARFTGAGGGGCVWALGDAQQIAGLRSIWQDIVQLQGDDARLLETAIDTNGIL
jgi:D-glycero-alpha-D-manno-heptose-7-phosphate kinase